MNALAILTAALLHVASGDPFSARIELQGIYDEISQATLQFESESDIDDFHDVFCTSDWTFVDAQGRQHSWPEMRQDAVDSLRKPPPEKMRQAIQTLSLRPDGASTLVTLTTTSTTVDDTGRYGRKGQPHLLTETTVFRDDWIGGGDRWRLKSRTQVGPSKMVVDRPETDR